MTLNTVGIPRNFLTREKGFNASWTWGANKKAMLFSYNNSSTCSLEKYKEIPSASSTSALPALLVMLRLPCLATGIPAPAMTKAEVVLILKLWDRSPPVPQLSRAFGIGEVWNVD